MKDARALLPTRGERDLGEERRRLLQQIGRALHLPASAFSRDALPQAAPGGVSLTECIAVLSAFSRIRDPLVRSHCIATLERCAEA